MTITSSSSAPLFVVVGSTGTQGRSVVDAIAADAKEYRVRAITRDTSKPAAQELKSLGAEVVAGDISDAASIEKAFQGADVVYGMTVSDYWSPNGEERELNQGKLLADTTKKVGAETLIFSGLPSQAQFSNGSHPVWSFDIKYDIVQYARSIEGLKVIDVQPGSFTSNYWQHQGPRKTPDGSYILPLAYAADTKVPSIDIPADYGRYALGALHQGVETVIAASEYITPPEIAEAFTKFSGKQVTFVQVPDDKIHEILKGNGGEKFATTLVAMFKSMRDAGYFGGVDLAPSQKVLSSPARTFAQSLEANRDAVEKVFA